MSWESREGLPYPLGVSQAAGGEAYNFAVYSRHATKIEVLFFEKDDVSRPAETRVLEHRTGSVWHARFASPELQNFEYYGFRVDGPAPEGRHAWHHFDPEKVLFDPYSKAVYFPESFHRLSAMEPGPTMGKAPLSVLRVDETPYDWRDDRFVRHEHDLVIYEAHVRGLTMNDPDVAPERRGTYAGVIDKIPYLKSLGVTALELLPVQQFDPQEKNYWGYMTISFFAPHHVYASTKDPQGVLNEFRDMVRALHEADIEVILDVVYNHSGEGNLDGPTYNL
ncbi:MAG: alpha-amylase family glycosyl hydrolase, partial [Planctomycetota bacterium]